MSENERQVLIYAQLLHVGAIYTDTHKRLEDLASDITFVREQMRSDFKVTRTAAVCCRNPAIMSHSADYFFVLPPPLRL